MANLDIDFVISESWELAKKHGLALGLMILGSTIITQAISSLFGIASYTELINAVQRQDSAAILAIYAQMAPAMLLSSAISCLITVGINNTALRIVQGKDNSVGFTGFNMPVMTYVKVLLAMLLYQIVFGIGLTCCVLPGIILGVRLFLAPTCLLDDPDMPFFEAFSKSWRITGGHFWVLVGIAIAFFVVVLIGFLCCCVGAYFAMAMTTLGQMIIFQVLKSLSAETSAAQPTEAQTDHYNKEI